MATLLMVESWLQSTGVALPQLIRDHGYDYVLVTRNPSTYPRDHPIVTHATDIFIAETNDHQPLVASVLALARSRRIDGVLTTCDYYLEAAARCAQALQLPGSPPHVMRLATQKHLVRDATRQAGLPTPQYAIAATWESALQAAAGVGFPLVAKPVDLNSGTSVHRVDDEAGLKDAFWAVTAERRNTRDQPLARLVLLEELLEGPEFSVEAVTRDGTTSVLGITEKVVAAPEFIELGHQFPARVNPGDAHEIEALVRRALDAIGFTHGLSHTEVKLTSGGPRIVEINPRQGGGYIFDLIRLVTGTDPLHVLIDLALGRQPAIGTPAAPLRHAGLVASAAVRFIMPPYNGTTDDDARAQLNDDPAIYRWELQPPSGTNRVRDNNDRIGHVLAVDPTGDTALDRAQTAVNVLRS